MPETPRGWRLARIDELGTVERGRSRHRPRNDPILYGGSYPFVQTGDVKAADLRLFQYSQTYNETGLAQSRLWPEGTLCITIAANICDTAILGISACFPDSIVGFTAHEGVSDAVFVKYAIDVAKQRFTNISRGATQDNLSLEKLLSQRLPIPPLAEQRRIASILGSYDDLIETNRRRIAQLEEIARRLFDEWFIRFRFPRHERHAMIDTPDGALPKGWSMRRIGDMTSYLSRGIAPKYDEGAVTKVINQKCIRDRRLSLEHARTQSRPVPSEKLVQPGDVLINSTGVGTLGRVAQAEVVEDGLTVDTHVTIVRSDAQRDKDFFGMALLRSEPLFERLGAGATGQTELNRNRIADVKLAEPPFELQRAFGTQVRPVRELAFKLGQQSNVLAASRDLLLPRLVSGELSVATAERKLEAVA